MSFPTLPAVASLLRRRRAPLAGAGLLALGLGAAGWYPPQPARSAAPAPQVVNVIRQIRTAPFPDPVPRAAAAIRPGVELELYSSDGFPVGNDETLLRIGNRLFTRSRYP